MAETTVERAKAVRDLAPAIEGLDPVAQQAAMRAVIAPADTATTNELWLRLITGLLILLAVALGGVIYLLADGKTPDVALTAFTALLTGLIGLFAPTPVKAT